jgi:hypothetical protein
MGYLFTILMKRNPFITYQKGIAVLIFLGIYAFYFCTSTGVNTSNDGGHVGLAKSIYYHHQLSVEKYLGVYVNVPDYAMKDGVIYSDRLPGTALLMLPAFAYADGLGDAGIATSNTNHELDVVIASLLPPLLGLLSALLLFWYYVGVLRKSFWMSLICTIIYAFGTLAWLESSHLFSHAPSLFLVTLAVFMVISNTKISWKNQLVFAATVLGFATWIELQNFLFFGPLLVYVLYKNPLLKKKNFRKSVFPVVLSLLILGVFIFGLLWYNYTTFDDWTLKSNKYNPFFPEERSFLSALSGNFFEGLDRLFTSFTNIEAYINPYKARLNDIPGVFVTSPVMILSVIGFFTYYKKFKAEALLLLSCIVIATLIAALHVTTLVRHIYTINLFLFLPFVFFVDALWKLPKGAKRTFLLILTMFLVLISFLRVGFSTVSYWGRNEENLFLYTQELPLFLLANLPLFFMVGMIWVLVKKRNVML